jgi:ribosome maturation factor RimP
MKTLLQQITETEAETEAHLETYFRSLGYRDVRIETVKKGKPGFVDVYLSDTSPVIFTRLNLNLDERSENDS